MAVHVDTAPQLDETLDDALWDRGFSLADFRQREPRLVSDGFDQVKIYGVDRGGARAPFIAGLAHEHALAVPQPHA